MERHEGSCACGQLKAVCAGVPDAIVQCHCKACQKRSGSVFAVGIYYPASHVTISGKAQRFSRETDSGADFAEFFCPDCATTLYWETERHPNGYGLALGAFESLIDNMPSRTVYDQNRCAWVEPLKIPRFVRGRDSNQIN